MINFKIKLKLYEIKNIYFIYNQFQVNQKLESKLMYKNDFSFVNGNVLIYDSFLYLP